MTTLDRYIARLYLTNIAILLVLLFSFVVMIDASLNMQRFADAAVKNASAAGSELHGLRKLLSAALLVVDLWWPRLLQLYNFLIGLVLVGAMGFTFAQLVRQRELVAVMASGVSLYRLMRPVMVVAALMLMIQVANQELVLPRISHLLIRDNMEAGKRDISGFVVSLRPDSEGRVFYADRFDPASRTMTNVRIWERDAQWRTIGQISASSATFDPQTRIWRLTKGVVQRARATSSASSGSEPVELGRPEPIAQLKSDLDDTGLIALERQSFAQNLSWGQIGDLLLSPTLRPDVKEQLSRVAWGRVANYICVVLSLVVAIPFFLTREPKNMVLQSIKCAPVAIGSLIGSTLAILSPIPGLPVELAVFLPVLALLPTAIAMGTSIKT
ncbi:MAG: LptF/LptG family permease [Phycisphaerales bacterium]|nr:LptF/LptG family permease [Phycisphaerales bacterium]